MKKYLIISAIAAMAFASCANDEFLNKSSGSPPNVSAENAISFNGSRSNLTRSTTIEGAKAAEFLGNNFIVYGEKTKDREKSTVYNYYNVNWVSDDEHTNGAWIYEGQTKNKLNESGSEEQTLKYWDYSASSYDFTAFTLGGSGITVVRKEGEAGAAPSYTFSGNYQELQSCYIADRIVLNSPSAFGNSVKFSFHSTGTKVGMSIYETIPGYSIKEIKFYDGTEEEEEEESVPIAKPMLYAQTACIPENHALGTLTVTYDDSNTAKLNLQEATPPYKESETESDDKSQQIVFNKFVLNAKNEYNESDNVNYLGRKKDAATSTGLKAVSPCNIEGGLTLKIDYTLVSTDGSGEEILIKGATAKIPGKYTNWEEGHVYSYVFKITEETNGTTGGNQAGLHPIVFDAVVIEDVEGNTKTEYDFDNPQTGTPTTPSGDN